MPWSGGLNWKRQRTSNEFTGKVSRYRGSEIVVEIALPKQSGTIPKEIIAECQDLSNSFLPCSTLQDHQLWRGRLSSSGDHGTSETHVEQSRGRPKGGYQCSSIVYAELEE